MSASSKEFSKVQQVLDRCRDRGLRCTKLLSLTIELFVNAGRPLTAKEIFESQKIDSQFDQASVYRLIIRLEQGGILRRIGLLKRSACYSLRHSQQCDDYIICTVCGGVEKMNMDCPVRSIQRTVANASGYQNLEHELKFFGVCPKCSNTE